MHLATTTFKDASQDMDSVRDIVSMVDTLRESKILPIFDRPHPLEEPYLLLGITIQGLDPIGSTYERCVWGPHVY